MVGPLIGIAARAVIKRVAKSAAKKTAKKKITSNTKLERTLRAENKGDARTTGKIKKLREQERSGLISPRERMNALNRMTKSYKSLPKKKSAKRRTR